MTSHVQISDLTVNYGREPVIENLNLEIREGEFVSVVGRSGVGKSTLLHAIAGLIEYSGEVLKPSRLGIVFQNFAVFPWMTVEENIGIAIANASRESRKKIVGRYLDLINLREHSHKYPMQLSGGQTQRVALARAFAAEPQVVLCDEPFGSLDIYTREKMQTWLLDVWEQERKTVVFVTHSIDEAIYLSDRILVMGNGTIVDEFRVDFTRPRLEEIKFHPEFVSLKLRATRSMQPKNYPVQKPIV